MAGKKKATKKGPKASAQGTIPPSVAAPPRAQIPRNPQASGTPSAADRFRHSSRQMEAGALNRHGGRVTQVDLERGVLPNSEDGNELLTDHQKELVIVNIRYHMKFGKHKLTPGPVEMPRHMAHEVNRMQYVKQKSDESIFIGKKYLYSQGKRHSVDKIF